MARRPLDEDHHALALGQLFQARVERRICCSGRSDTGRGFTAAGAAATATAAARAAFGAAAATARRRSGGEVL